jgi:hypothetical protein
MKLRVKWKQNHHLYKKHFWQMNYPLCAALYFLASPKVMGLYIALCSIYANVETSDGADEAKKAQS